MGSSEPRVGDTLGRYRLLELLGRGGMGTVFRARDDELERDVAVKVINASLADEGEFRDRFRREAVVLSRMTSAHVVAVHDHGEQDGSPYIVTQLVAGGDLLGLIRSHGVLAPSYALDLVGQVLEGLADAHEIGVVHRDVKPSNVLLGADGRTAYLCDFGIATSPGGEVTRTGVQVGSIGYMAPERHTAASSSDVGVTADVYAVGCVLWQLLTGTQPFVGTDAEVAMGHLRGPVPQLPGEGALLDRLNGVLARALAKDPRRRYPSAKAMHADIIGLRAMLPGGFVVPEVTSVRQSLDLPPERPGRRRVLTVALVTALVLLGVWVGSLIGGVDVMPSMLASDEPSETGTTASEAPSAVESPRAGDSAIARERREVREARERAEQEERSGGQSSRRARKPGSDGSVRPRPRTSHAPSPTPRSNPRPAYRCWSGTGAGSLAACGWPTGAGGYAWVFPRSGSIGGCKPASKSAPGYLRGWVCARRTGDGTMKSINFQQWRTLKQAKAYVRGRYQKKYSDEEWVINGVHYGWRMTGRTPKGFMHTARIYRQGDTKWVVTAQGKTVKKRQSMFQLVGFRKPGQLRGVRN